MNKSFESLRGQLATLFEGAAEDDVDKAVAQWYLSKHVASDLSDAPRQKALAVHRTHSLEFLGDVAYRLGHRAEAKQYYLESAYAQLRSFRSLRKTFDYVLRHGSREETLAFARAVSQHNSIPFDAIVQQFYDQYAYFIDAILQSLAPDFLGERSKLANIVAWGDGYVWQMLHYFFPCLLAEGNLVRLAHEFDVTFIVFTDEKGAQEIARNLFFRKISQLAKTKILTISPALITYANTAFNGAFKFIFSTFLTNIAHYATLECGRRLRTGVLTLHPDSLFTDGLMSTAGDSAYKGFAALANAGFRIHQGQGNFAYFDLAFRNSDLVLSIPFERLERDIMPMVPEPYFVDSREFSSFPLAVCWKTGARSFVAHINHYGPLHVAGSHLTREIEPCLDPIDGFFLSKYLDDPANVAVITDHIGVSFEPNVLVDAPRPGSTATFNSTHVARWLRLFLTPFHAKYFRQRRAFGQAEGELADAAADSARIVEEILELASRSDWL